MESIDDPSHLREQYKTRSNLDSRGNLHARFSTSPEGWFAWLFRQMTFPEAAAILEAGCGTGELWITNRERLSRDWTLTLTDLSPGMIETATGNTTGLKPGMDFRVADIQDLPFADNQFDVVVANHMLYHVPDLNRALEEVCRVMRKPGVLYCATNGMNHMKELAELLTGFAGKQVGQAFPELKFRTDNGGELLSRYFSRVVYSRFHDDLLVTEVEPLVSYYFSSPLLSGPVKDRKAEFHQYLAAELNRSGAIRIRKDVGLFAAYL